MEDEPSPPKSNHKEESNLYFVPQLGLLTPVMIIENLILILFLKILLKMMKMLKTKLKLSMRSQLRLLHQRQDRKKIWVGP